MENTDDSSVAAPGEQPHHHHQQHPQLPPGFRFHPTDEELVVHYLKRKAQSAPLPTFIIAEVDLYKFDPWELPAKAVFGEQEWYFFSPRDRKYPNGARPNRAATSGYWKATGTDKPIMSTGNQKVGVKKALVFYGGKPPRGLKTNWIMHEYRLVDDKPINKPPGYHLSNNNNKGSLRLDDWVLCRIYKKSNTAQRSMELQEREDAMEDMMLMGPMMSVTNSSINSNLGHHDHHQLSKSVSDLNYNSFLESHDQAPVGGGMYEPGVITNSQGVAVPTIHMMGQSLSPHHLPSETPSSTMMPLKRTLTSLYWPGIDDTKRLSVIQANSSTSLVSNDNNNNSCSDDSRNIDQNRNQGNMNANSNLPSADTPPPLHQPPSMLGPLSEGVFRQPYSLSGLNWFT